MDITLSIRTRNALTEAEKSIRRVPEAYRKDLCKNLMDNFANPATYVLTHSCCSLHDSFHEVCGIYNKLCEFDKEQFTASFPKMCKQFGVIL